ncbi:histidine--tRNA ligase [Halobacillus litoralis]|uniref:histidine--tRNA ligase n=1 Tax=Halobacillus litoralis TaxID=45668 RepID=UPI001CD5A348|nr:histidine--tRNA ligase [Halobacillus litoralis]
MKDQNVKGTKDFLPEEERKRRHIRRTLENAFISYGCLPLETPILNEQSLMASKYAGGAEILKEMYTLSDRGERELALRYDLTIPFAKVAAMNPQLKKPFKRYEIGKVFRDGPIKKGRNREFTQCDVDVVGAEFPVAEAELMVMALDAFDELGMSVVLEYNNRKLLTGMLKRLGISSSNVNEAILILDKVEKIGVEKVLDQLGQLDIEGDTRQRIEDYITDERSQSLSYYQTLEQPNEELKEGIEEIEQLQEYIEALDIQSSCLFQPFLARGLDIYTGTIYEVFLKDNSLSSSIASGGRYDNAVGGFLGTNESISTVGLSFGLDVMFEAVSISDEVDVDVFVTTIGCPKQGLQVATKLRRQGKVVELDLSNKKLKKALERADAMGVSEVIIIGGREVEDGCYRLRDMQSGEETTVPFSYASF